MQNKIALITGASRGIGAAVAKRYAELGAHVILTARTVSGLEEVDDYIKSVGGSSTIVPLDLNQFNKIDELGSIIASRFKKLDILVGNAGMLGHLSPVTHTDPSIWERVFNINVTANYRLLRSFEPLLKQSEAGRAIFVTSGVTKSVLPYWGAYAASKIALEHMVKIYAAETTKTKIRANLVDPGMVATKMLSEAMPGLDLNDYKKPDAITEIFVRLAASDLKETGQIFTV